MFVASEWKDYTLIDAGGGKRLERWGDYVLVRPDPQVIWGGGDGVEWKKAHGIYSRSSGGGGSWVKRICPRSGR